MELQRFKSKRLTSAQLEGLRERTNQKYPLVGYHYELYNLIETATNEGRKISVREICQRMPEYYYLNEKECNYSNCPNLYKDIDYLNHAKFRKIICKDNGGFFLATKEEAQTYEKKLLQEALKAFNEYWTVHKKVQANDQGVFIDANGNVIDEQSHAKRFIESFVTTAVAGAFQKTEFRDTKTSGDNNLPTGC